MVKISIANEFTTTPGARFKTDGPFSGEEFREKFLEPKFSDPNLTENVFVDLDGTEGYATSFLEEAFGGLARIYGKKICLKRLSFKSDEEPGLIAEITGYINDVEKD